MPHSIVYGGLRMPVFTMVIFSAVITSILACIIDDCFEWKENVDIKLVLVKMTVLAAAPALVLYPFAKASISHGTSSKEIFLSYVLLFGCLSPILGKLFILGYGSLRDSHK
jgi:ABC-type anion transport system duplicated permease subunit